MNYFSISSRLGHKPNYPLKLVGVTFLKLVQALRDVWHMSCQKNKIDTKKMAKSDLCLILCPF